MTLLCNYHRNDALQVGQLIKDTYSEFNLSFLPLENQADYLGPFQYAYSNDPDRQRDVHEVIQSECTQFSGQGSANPAHEKDVINLTWQENYTGTIVGYQADPIEKC